MVQGGDGVAVPVLLPVPVPTVGLECDVVLHAPYLVIVVGTIVSSGQLHVPIAVVVMIVSLGQKQVSDLAETVVVTMLSRGQAHVGVIVANHISESCCIVLPISTHLSERP